MGSSTPSDLVSPPHFPSHYQHRLSELSLSPHSHSLFALGAALATLHHAGCVHQDFTPTNVLMNAATQLTGQCAIIDFEHSTFEGLNPRLMVRDLLDAASTFSEPHFQAIFAGYNHVLAIRLGSDHPAYMAELIFRLGGQAHDVPSIRTISSERVLVAARELVSTVGDPKWRRLSEAVLAKLWRSNASALIAFLTAFFVAGGDITAIAAPHDIELAEPNSSIRRAVNAWASGATSVSPQLHDSIASSFDFLQAVRHAASTSVEQAANALAPNTAALSVVRRQLGQGANEAKHLLADQIADFFDEIAAELVLRVTSHANGHALRRAACAYAQGSLVLVQMSLGDWSHDERCLLTMAQRHTALVLPTDLSSDTTQAAQFLSRSQALLAHAGYAAMRARTLLTIFESHQQSQLLTKGETPWMSLLWRATGLLRRYILMLSEWTAPPGSDAEYSAKHCRALKILASLQLSALPPLSSAILRTQIRPEFFLLEGLDILHRELGELQSLMKELAVSRGGASSLESLAPQYRTLVGPWF